MTTTTTTSTEPDAPAPSLLRFATAGSVDDGKSTLVGRLLHDTKSILADAYESVERASRSRGAETVDLALLTDGLRAEREQGITIDVAYRYFSTPRRTFILADCPGHVQYTRNAITGASTADALVVLVDARYGVVEQTRRHLAVAALLRVPHVIVAVNKIDLLDFAAGPFETIARRVRSHAEALGLPDVVAVPVSALHGDNVAVRSERTPWYEGPTVLEALETAPSVDEAAVAGAGGGAGAGGVGSAGDVAGAGEGLEASAGADARAGWRFPVQLVLRPQDAAIAPEFREYRGYAGQVAEGTVRVGDAVVVQPSGSRTTIAAIDTADGPLREAGAGRSVAVRLADDVDVARGDLLSSVDDAAPAARRFHAHVAWLAERPLRVRDRVLVQHGSAVVQAMVASIDGVLDIALPGGTLDSSIRAGHELLLNDIGVVELQLAQPLAVEDYGRHRRTGAFVLVDPQDGATLAAGTARAQAPGSASDAYVRI
ncbi:sulfate adenylyltransferase subunit 1 [Demequina pelophila]|uniref:sulfate adenylyltransferase subunit 1 n=1 Tax=Demequina pelophila TaxID=1638984 RepID=UPI0007864E06|nr:GTP-binding protein [Demequina pelophila]